MNSTIRRACIGAGVGAIISGIRILDAIFSPITYPVLGAFLVGSGTAKWVLESQDCKSPRGATIPLLRRIARMRFFTALC